MVIPCVTEPGRLFHCFSTHMVNSLQRWGLAWLDRLDRYHWGSIPEELYLPPPTVPASASEPGETGIQNGGTDFWTELWGLESLCSLSTLEGNSQGSGASESLVYCPLPHTSSPCEQIWKAQMATKMKVFSNQTKFDLKYRCA